MNKVPSAVPNAKASVARDSEVGVQAMAETAPLNATEIRCSSDPRFRSQTMIKLSSAKKNGNERKHNEIPKLLTTAQKSCGVTTELD